MARPPTPEKVSLKPYYRALKGKNVPIMSSIQWVANNLGVPIEEFKPDEPPCYFAVQLLEWANEPGNKTTFFKEFMTKVIPTKTQLEADERLRDDGRALTILSQFEKDFHANRAQGPDSESPVPPGGDQAGGHQPPGPPGDSDGGGA